MHRYTISGAVVTGLLVAGHLTGLPGAPSPLAAQVAEATERETFRIEGRSEAEAFDPRVRSGYQAGLRDGMEEGRGYTNGAWFGLPLALVSVTGPIGAVVAPGLAVTLRPDAADVVRLESAEAEYRAGFEEGFRRQTRRDRIIRSVQGGLVGILAYFAVQALFSGDALEEGATANPGVPQL